MRKWAYYKILGGYNMFKRLLLAVALLSSGLFFETTIVKADEQVDSAEELPILSPDWEIMDVETNGVGNYDNLPVLTPEGEVMEIDQGSSAVARSIIGPTVPKTIYKEYTVVAFKTNYPYGPPSTKQWAVSQYGQRYTGKLKLLSKKTVPLGWECVYGGNLSR